MTDIVDRATRQDYGGDTGTRYRSRAKTAQASSCDGAPLPDSIQRAARTTRHRSPEMERGHFRTRLLLASPRQVSIQYDAAVQLIWNAKFRENMLRTLRPRPIFASWGGGSQSYGNARCGLTLMYRLLLPRLPAGRASTKATLNVVWGTLRSLNSRQNTDTSHYLVGTSRRGTCSPKACHFGADVTNLERMR